MQVTSTAEDSGPRGINSFANYLPIVLSLAFTWQLTSFAHQIHRTKRNKEALRFREMVRIKWFSKTLSVNGKCPIQGKRWILLYAAWAVVALVKFVFSSLLTVIVLCLRGHFDFFELFIHHCMYGAGMILLAMFFTYDSFSFLLAVSSTPVTSQIVAFERRI